MKRYLSPIRLVCLFGILFQIILALGVVAQEPKIDGLAKTVAKKISHAKIKSVVLQNFTAPDGSPSPQGKLLTALLFNYWGTRHESFSVLQPDELEKFLSEHKFSAGDLDTRENLQQMSSTLNVEALVSGTIAPGPSKFVLSVSVRRIHDGEIMAAASQTFPRSGIFGGFDTPSPDGSPLNVYRAGLNGVGTPTCAYCPQPDYSDRARASKIRGTVLLDVVVTAEGRVAKIVVLKSPDAELEVKAVEAIKSWKFKPAIGPAANPVAVRVQIEITFHLYG